MKEDDEMNYFNQPEYDISFIEWDPTLCFQVEEACQLLNREVIRIEDRADLAFPSTEKTGIVVGVLVMNDEVEVLVKFMSGMEQLVKTEFCGDFILAPNQ